MILKISKTMSTRVNSAAGSVKAQFPALVRRLILVSPEHGIHEISLTSQAGCAVNTGRTFRLTRRHVPNFSLFTYFGDRQ